MPSLPARSRSHTPVHFEIRHITNYQYSAPVHLGPHTVRLLPRSDGNQRLLDYRCSVTPEPEMQSNVLDADGNPVTCLWFAGSTTGLRIDTACRVETLQKNPYAYIVDTPANSLPIPYDRNDVPLLGAYLEYDTATPAVAGLAARLAGQAANQTLPFLDTLNGFLHHEIEKIVRDQGAPQSPEFTLTHRRGACRDLATLFIAICRNRGIAARFVSGYQARAETRRERRYLHAWPEVYIPGGGWRGYDPSHGTTVADAHVALAAASRAAGTLPVEGAFYGDGAHSRMDFELGIHTDD